MQHDIDTNFLMRKHIMSRPHTTLSTTRRALRGDYSPLLLYRIDASGHAHECGVIELLYPEGCTFSFSEPALWPLDDEMEDGWFRGLPYFFADMRPQGFLGRNFAGKVASSPLLVTTFKVDADVHRWNEDDVLCVLNLWALDQPGNYILGDQCLRQFLHAQSAGRAPVLDIPITSAYPQLAMQVMRGDVFDH